MPGSLGMSVHISLPFPGKAGLKGRCCGACCEAAVGSFRGRGTGTTFGEMRTVLKGERMKCLNPGEQILVRSVIKKSFCSVLLVAVKHAVLAFVGEIRVLLAACSLPLLEAPALPSTLRPCTPQKAPSGEDKQLVNHTFHSLFPLEIIWPPNR